MMLPCIYTRVQDEYLRVGGLLVQLVVLGRRVPRSVQVSVVVQVGVDTRHQQQRRRVSLVVARVTQTLRYVHSPASWRRS